MSRTRTRMIRLRMAETGEKYTTAMRAIEADALEQSRLREALQLSGNRARYPFTDRDGLDRRHVLSAFETQRGRH